MQKILEKSQKDVMAAERENCRKTQNGETAEENPQNTKIAESAESGKRRTEIQEVVPPVVLTVQLVKPCNNVNSICIAFSVLWYKDTRHDGKSDCGHNKTRVKWCITMYCIVLGCFSLVQWLAWL